MPLLQSPDPDADQIIHGESGTVYKVKDGGFFVEDDDPNLESLSALFPEHSGPPAPTEASAFEGEPTEATEGPSEDAGTAYEDSTVAELHALADERGLDVPSRANKGEIIAALEEDDAAEEGE